MVVLGRRGSAVQYPNSPLVRKITTGLSGGCPMKKTLLFALALIASGCAEGLGFVWDGRS
jgi:hypothetical protein